MVESASSAAEALEALQKSKPDVLITDIGMPDEDGYSLIRQVRKLTAETAGEIPAIALTAFARSEDRRRAMLSGFQMHLAKPVEPSELIAMVANLARRADFPLPRLTLARSPDSRPRRLASRTSRCGSPVRNETEREC